MTSYKYITKKKIKEEEQCDWDTSLKIVKGKVKNSNIANEKHHVSGRSVCQEKQEIWFEGGMQQQISDGLFLAKHLPCVLGAMWQQRKEKTMSMTESVLYFECVR